MQVGHIAEKPVSVGGDEITEALLQTADAGQPVEGSGSRIPSATAREAMIAPAPGSDTGVFRRLPQA